MTIVIVYILKMYVVCTTINSYCVMNAKCNDNQFFDLWALN